MPAEATPSHEQSLARLPFELLNGLSPDPRARAPHFRSTRSRVLDTTYLPSASIVRRRIPSNQASLPSPPAAAALPLHHFVSHPAKEEGIGLGEVLDRVTMQVFVRDHYTMIAAPVQRDVDGIPKRSAYVRARSPSGTLTKNKQHAQTVSITKSF